MTGDITFSHHRVITAHFHTDMAHCADCCSDKPPTLRIFELQHLTRVQDSESDPTRTRGSKSLSDILVYHDIEGPLTAISHSESTNSIVYRGALLTEKQGQGPSPRELSRVILKMGFGDNAIQRLLQEYKCYKSLVPLQGEQIPLCHGLYHGYMAGSERTAAACLLLEDCGDPCAQADNPALTEMPWKFRFVLRSRSIEQHDNNSVLVDNHRSRKSVVQCVELLHKTYGVGHKKLIISSDKKILVRRIGNERKPCIVGFGQATVNEHKCPVNMCVADQPWRIASRRSVHNKCPELLEIALIVDLWIPSEPSWLELVL